MNRPPSEPGVVRLSFSRPWQIMAPSPWEHVELRRVEAKQRRIPSRVGATKSLVLHVTCNHIWVQLDFLCCRFLVSEERLRQPPGLTHTWKLRKRKELMSLVRDALSSQSMTMTCSLLCVPLSMETTRDSFSGKRSFEDFESGLFNNCNNKSASCFSCVKMEDNCGLNHEAEAL